jgi:DNA-nicking Smr family endonuclease
MKLGAEIAASMERFFPVTETVMRVLPAARYECESFPMKKSKTRNQGPGDFNNNPFESLKSFKLAADSAQGKKTTTPARKEKADGDTALFLRAVRGARAIKHRSENQPDAMKYKAAEQRRRADQDEQQLFLQAIQKIGTTFRDESPKTDGDEPGRRSASSRIRQLKRGTITLSDELDLHGYVKDEALRRLKQFITGAYSRGQRAVLVITGKGINSIEGPVLQGAVAAWLREKGRGMIAEFAPAPREKGGSGAFVVFLKSK